MLKQYFFHCPNDMSVISFPQEGGKTTCEKCGTRFEMWHKENDKQVLRIECTIGPRKPDPYGTRRV